MISQATDVAARGIDVPETDLVIQGELMHLRLLTYLGVLMNHPTCNCDLSCIT